ncbi:SEH-associated protein 4 [Podospora fimiseda]|uniref:SEH-associated protein 4 n=1 Tax=Podospora fimiseda TaxID=252190 RepID=A0AAN7BIR9_9PEZI|nr:SEH-associated protein 4 [Podospora fimiseda]
MDRPEPGLIKWSPNPDHDSFLHVNLQHRIVQVFEPTGHAQKGRFEYKKISKHDDLPPLTTYDWSPSIPGLVAVGTSTGVVNLLRIDDNSNAYLELNLKMSRTCHAVAFNTTGKLAVALDRVRNDNCLYIWDVNRLSTMDNTLKGFPTDVEPPSDPTDRLEPSVSVSSVKFFEDNPNLLVAGIKGQGLRIHDLRDPQKGVIQFQTKCCNNLAIDYADPNYFASSALDQPGVMVWDRRAINRNQLNPTYADALERDNLPWGGALRLDRAVQMEADPAAMDSKNSFIRSLRFSRDHAGMLAVLSRTGQLKLLSTKREYEYPNKKVEGSPELLEVRRSYELDPLYAELNRRNEKIVSFDWITMNSPVLQPRLLVLRANGAFDILEKPSFTSEYPFKLVPWQAPYRGFEGDTPYHEALDLEPPKAQEIFAPLLTEQALADQPIFGPEKPDIEALVEEIFENPIEEAFSTKIINDKDLPETFANASSIADKLTALRLTAEESEHNSADAEPPSQLECHEQLLTNTKNLTDLPSNARSVLDHIMMYRAKEGYLFNYSRNQQIVADDPWLRDAWAWVSGAEEAATDGGMMTQPLDLGYLGVYTIWNNKLGSKPSARLSDINSPPPDKIGWERCINTINKRLHIPKYDGTAPTRWPHHRELCVEMCGWGRSYEAEFREAQSVTSLKKDSTWHTMTAAHALFRGDTKGAVQVLKKASSEHPGLLFVSLALQLIGKTNDLKNEALDFDERVASKTDPYLRAISSIIATNDWTIIANQKSLPLRDRLFVALRNFSDEDLTVWLEKELAEAASTGNLEGIVLTGISDSFVDILARYVQKFGDFQTATLLISICSPRFIDDIRATAFRNAYRQYLQRHHMFFIRAKFDVESTKRSKHHGRPTVKLPGKQITVRCVYCDAEAAKNFRNYMRNLQNNKDNNNTNNNNLSVPSALTHNFMKPAPTKPSPSEPPPNPSANAFTEKMVAAGISCPTCKRHLPRCVVCLEIIGLPRSDKPEMSRDPETRNAAKFPTFCMQCKHCLHLDHARAWFRRHQECPVPECHCKCNLRINDELHYR